jgi:hypothetical protein
MKPALETGELNIQKVGRPKSPRLEAWLLNYHKRDLGKK